MALPRGPTARSIKLSSPFTSWRSSCRRAREFGWEGERKRRVTRGTDYDDAITPEARAATARDSDPVLTSDTAGDVKRRPEASSVDRTSSPSRTKGGSQRDKKIAGGTSMGRKVARAGRRGGRTVCVCTNVTRAQLYYSPTRFPIANISLAAPSTSREIAPPNGRERVPLREPFVAAG